MARQQLPVVSPIRPHALLRAAVAPLGRNRDGACVENMLSERFGACGAVMTDSGTSALVLALHCAAGEGGVVALPAYGCYDLAAAAVFLGLRVRLYDIDPSSLSADLDSLRDTFAQGVAAAVIVHLFGYPSNISEASALAAEYGVVVIEDAAQGAAGTLGGRVLGSFGPLTVLSFGRGKGLTAGSGGALLAMSESWRVRATSVALGAARGHAGWVDLGIAATQWVIGRPALYALPASIPALHLGETVYRDAHEPQRMTGIARSLLRSALPSADRDADARRATAARILAMSSAEDLAPIVPIASGNPGYLRLAVRDLAARGPSRPLGIVRGYPITLAELSQLQPNLCAGQPTHRGAMDLRDTLFTLPTHELLTSRDIASLQGWMRRRSSGAVR